MLQEITTLSFASSLSETAQTQAALDEAICDLTRRLNGPADLVVVFTTAHHRERFDLIQCRLAEALSPRVTVGATAAGVIGTRREVEKSPGLSVLAARLPGGINLHPFTLRQTDWPAAIDSPSTLRETVEGHHNLPTASPIKAVLLIADPFSTPMSDIPPAFNKTWPNVPLVGGMASAANSPGGNRLLLNGEIFRDGAVGVALSGNIRVDCTVSQGCRPVGKPCVITKSKQHVVQELGGKKALEVVYDIIQNLDEEDKELVTSRGIVLGRVINEYKDRFGLGDFLIRHLIGVDQPSGQIAVGDPHIRVGQTVQFHVHDRKAAEQDFRLLLEVQKLHGPAEGALLFTCNGRGTHLFDQPHSDATLIQEALGDVPLSGFFAAGELGPIGGENFVHGHTASLFVFRPAEPTPVVKI
jgi:small ligand-binding sensory domain FIST